MIRLFWYGIGAILSVVLVVVAGFGLLLGYIIVVHPIIWQVQQRILDRYGTEVVGSVLKVNKQLDPRDTEYEDYTVTYEYPRHGKRITDTHKFSMNTVHLWYANMGELDHTPKLMTTLDDFESTFQPASPVTVTYLAYYPKIKRIEFERHPNQLLDEKIWTEYNRENEQA